ncbi:MAG: PAS domain S-box protein, partial [Candidatus Fermentibacteria bacterium]|nr:PAS domain S-box protein [Candidatus Fermentibacteria bacterium]
MFNSKRINPDPEGDLLSETYLQVFSDQGVCAFIVAEESRRIVSVNDILCSILGKDSSSIMDGTAEQLLDEIAGSETNIMQRKFVVNKSSYSIFSFKHSVHGEQNPEKDILMRDMFYHGVVQSVPDAVLTTDKKGIITAWNRAAEDLFGWSTQEAVGRSVDQLVRSGSGQDDISSSEIINGKVIRAFECIRRGKEDTEKKVSVSVAPIVVHGENVGAVGIYKDLSHRESIRKRLEENEIKFRAITETAQDAVIIIDSDSRVSFFNSSAELMFGYKRSETLGRKLHHLIAPESYWEMIEMGFKQFRETGKGIMVGRVVEMEGRRKNGSVFPVELSVSSFFMDGGWQATGILRDISERKGIELELIEAREAALNAARTQSEFLANMSHEIRTPLNAIIGTTDLMLDTELTSSQKNLLRLSRNASDNLLNIVNDILDISKVEAGKIELERIPFDLHEDLEKTCETLSLRAHEKKLELICRIHPDTPRWVSGDSPRLRQVLINLIGNAVKFTSLGEIFVEVKPYDQGRISFSVTDTGIGIPPGKVESIFMSFTQADSSHTRRYGGTGLGLAISTRLVDLMGGTLSVRSQVDSGSTFTFFCDLPETESMSLPEKFEKCDLSGKHILVVDDNNSSRLLLKELLEDDGASVHIADGGTSAMDMIRGSRYDAILLDCSMPDLDGFKTTEEMKKNSIDSREIVMMLTSDNSDEQIKKCESLGVEHYLYKPLRRNHLRKQVMSVIEGFAVSSHPASFSRPGKYPIEEMHLSLLLAEDSPDNRFLILKYTEDFPWEITVAEN